MQLLQQLHSQRRKNLTCPAVSQSWSLIGLSSTRTTTVTHTHTASQHTSLMQVLSTCQMWRWWTKLKHWVQVLIAQQIDRSYSNKKLARLLFDFTDVNTTNGDCEEQVPTVRLCLQQVTTPAVWWQSCSVDNGCGLTPSRAGGRINIWTYFYLKPEYLAGGGVSVEDLNAAAESAVPTSI